MKILKISKQDPKDLEKLDSFLSKCSTDKKKPTGFIHYSDISKFGLKPIQEGGTVDQLTPLGIYGYPVQFSDKQRILDAKFSYAEGRNFIYLFFVKNQNKILYVENYTISDFEKDIDKLIVFSESKNFKKINKESLLESAKKYTGPVAKKLYDFSFSLLRYSSEIFKDSLDAEKNLSKLKYTNAKSSYVWTKILRGILGYEGIVDTGWGMIHGNEKSQGVFFSTSFVDLNAVIQNPAVKNLKHFKSEKPKSNNLKTYAEFKQELGSDIDLKENQLEMVDNIPISELKYLENSKYLEVIKKILWRYIESKNYTKVLKFKDLDNEGINIFLIKNLPSDYLYIFLNETKSLFLEDILSRLKQDKNFLVLNKFLLSDNASTVKTVLEIISTFKSKYSKSEFRDLIAELEKIKSIPNNVEMDLGNILYSGLKSKFISEEEYSKLVKELENKGLDKNIHDLLKTHVFPNL